MDIARRIRSFGQILTQQPFGVLIGPALPVDYVDPNRTSGSQGCVPGARSAIFPPPIHKSVISAACQHIFELPGKSLWGTHRIRPVEPSQDDQACRSFDEAANGRAIAGRGHCGGSTSGIMLEIRPRRSNPCARGWRALCSDAARARVRGTGCHVATRTGPLDGLTRKVLPNAIRIFPLETPSHLFGQISSAQVCPDIPS
jgi:hypothetical protein